MSTTFACLPTPPDLLGPFYVPDAPVRAKVGESHRLQGIVRDASTCDPIVGVKIEFWLVNEAGVYTDDKRSTQYTDNSGAYRFESNIPVVYDDRPAHIHLRLSADGYWYVASQYYPQPGQTRGVFDIVLEPRPVK